jgi:hypothetical protein
MKRILALVANGPWRCVYCGYEFSSEVEGAAHSRAVHGVQ